MSAVAALPDGASKAALVPGSKHLWNEQIRVAPFLAKRWLEKNHPENRPINWPWVEALANDMRNGKYPTLHMGICFDREGNLIDGQHRLSALVQADVAIEMIVFWNMIGSFHDPIDRVRVRSVATIMGVSSTQTAALNTLRMLEQGYDQKCPMTLADCESVMERHRSELEQLDAVAGKSRMGGPLKGACAWAWPIDPQGVAQFVKKVSTGEMIARGDAAYAYRVWAERGAAGLRSWERAMAALNCLRHSLTGTSLVGVFTGESGYRSIVQRRRVLKVPYTPTAEIVPGEHWKPTPRGRTSDE